MLVPAIIAILFGIAGHLYVGVYASIPPEWISIAHNFNAIHVTACVVALFVHKRKLLRAKFDPWDRMLAYFEEHSILAVIVGVVTYCAILFYELFLFGTVFGLFMFSVVRVTYAAWLLCHDIIKAMFLAIKAMLGKDKNVSKTSKKPTETA